MGKHSNYTDSETENTDTSLENMKTYWKTSFRPSESREKKYKTPFFNRILKYTNVQRKKKCKIHSKSEPDDSDYTNTSHSLKSLRGILKNSNDDRRERDDRRDRERMRRKREREREYFSSEDDDDFVPPKPAPKPLSRNKGRCLVGQVPRPAGSKPGRGGGMAIIIRKAEKPITEDTSESCVLLGASFKRVSNATSQMEGVPVRWPLTIPQPRNQVLNEEIPFRYGTDASYYNNWNEEQRAKETNEKAILLNNHERKL